MIKKILFVLFIGLSCYGFYQLYRLYNFKKEEQRRNSYYQNLQDTSSPTVSMDSLFIDYQNSFKKLHIYVPPEYNSDTSKKYPVIYMMDGEQSFNDLTNMGPEWQIDEVINAASENGKPTAIVIGINDADERNPEYTPWKIESTPDAHGGPYAKWVTTELKNWVDQNFRTKTDPTNTAIGGISRSGMMAYYMFMKYPNIFGNAYIQSPSMWVDYDRLFAMQIPDEDLKSKKIFISVGEDEGGMVDLAKDVYNKFKAQGMTDKNLMYHVVPDEGHWHLTWRKSFAVGYPWMSE